MKASEIAYTLCQHLQPGSVLGKISPELKARIESAAIEQRAESGSFALGTSRWAATLVDSGWDGMSVRHQNPFNCIPAPRSAHWSKPTCPTLHTSLYAEFLTAAVGRLSVQQRGAVSEFVVTPV